MSEENPRGRIAALIHERDAVVTAMDHARSRHSEIAKRHRCEMALTCSHVGCGDRIAVTSSTDLQISRHAMALFSVAIHFGWGIGEATALELGELIGQYVPFLRKGAADLCPAHQAKALDAGGELVALSSSPAHDDTR